MNYNEMLHISFNKQGMPKSDIKLLGHSPSYNCKISVDYAQHEQLWVTVSVCYNKHVNIESSFVPHHHHVQLKGQRVVLNLTINYTNR